MSQVQVSFDGGAKITVPYGSSRADTSSVCGGQVNTGYGLLFNYNTLSVGKHKATTYADGAVIDTAQFTVTTLGSEFLTGAQGATYINNFPSVGKQALLAWQQATQNFAISTFDVGSPDPNGTYAGAVFGTNTSCGTLSGPFSVTNAQFNIAAAGTTLTIGVVLPGFTPSSCMVTGPVQFNVNGVGHSMQGGTFTCNDGSSGSVVSTSGYDAAGFTARVTMTQANGCVTTVHLAGARP